MYLCRLKYYCFIMSGKRKKDDSEAVGIMKFFKCTERNRISSKEPSDITERSSISSTTESVQINESTCVGHFFTCRRSLFTYVQQNRVSTCFHISNCPLPFHLHLHEISKFHSFIFILPLTRNTTTVYRSTLKIIYNIPTKLLQDQMW